MPGHGPARCGVAGARLLLTGTEAMAFQGDLRNLGLATVFQNLQQNLQTGTLNGTVSPFQVYLTCYLTFKQAGDPRAGQILDRAYRELQERASRIADVEMQRSFLQNVRPHRTIVREAALSQQPE